jgi:pyridoxal phosphate enzyme (YggS family)
MTIDKAILKENLDRARENIQKHKVCDVKLIAATKTQSKETIENLMELDDSIILGENRVQELIDKYDKRFAWHHIGQLQSNKVKYIVDKAALIHSLDRLSLAKELDAQAGARGLKAAALIEINIAGEAAKGGISPQELLTFACQLKEHPNLCVKGLMCVAPLGAGETELDGYFCKMRELFFVLKEFKADNFDVSVLSMGMSDDYIPALKRGSNMIRLGRALFGPRVY